MGAPVVLPAPGPIARRAAADCLTPEVLSIRETPGKNNFGKWVKVILGFVGLDQGNPWCMAHVETRLQKAAEELGVKIPAGMPITGYCPTFANWGKSCNRWISLRKAMENPELIQVGDIGFLYFANQGRVAHVGIVVGYLKNAVGHIVGYKMVEGNTGPEHNSGRDGDGVYLKERNFFEYGDPDFAGFVRFSW